jgi:hypothetical protein
MSHPGMAPVFGEAREVAPGQYQGSLEFGMPGDWVALIHVTLPDGRNLESPRTRLRCQTPHTIRPLLPSSLLLI